VDRNSFPVLDAKNVVKHNTTFVTSLPVNKRNVAEIVACGRALEDRKR
jgi:hypothetical protein